MFEDYLKIREPFKVPLFLFPHLLLCFYIHIAGLAPRGSLLSVPTLHSRSKVKRDWARQRDIRVVT